jgi:mRNA interferase RelE/StbE
MYVVYVLPQALQEIKRLPGHVRQRVKRLIDDFAADPRPPGSIELSNIPIPKPGVTLHRFRLDKWRIVYAVDEEAAAVDVMAVRQRPPYDYGDLQEIIRALR